MTRADKTKSRDELLSKLSSLDNRTGRLRFLSRHRVLLRPESVKKLAELAVAKIRANTAEALRLAEAALLIAQKLRRKEDLAIALRAKADALYACGENRLAVEHHENALRLFEALGERMEAARTLSHSIQPSILLGEYERAFKADHQAREIFELERFSSLARLLSEGPRSLGTLRHASASRPSRLQHCLSPLLPR